MGKIRVNIKIDESFERFVKFTNKDKNSALFLSTIQFMEASNSNFHQIDVLFQKLLSFKKDSGLTISQIIDKLDSLDSTKRNKFDSIFDEIKSRLTILEENKK